ncbi:MAG: TetR family transcriptional regulator C-terminal domain-containing protein [Actinomycetota bacterium]
MAEDRRPEILDATCRVIAKVGLHGMYIRHVADEAGVSRALVSYYFPTRDDLLAAALEHAELRAINEIGSRTRAGSARERITETLLLEFDDSPAVRDNWVIWSELTEAALFDGSFRGPMKAWSERWNEAIARMIEDGQRGGSIATTVRAADAAERLTGLVDGLGSRWLLGEVSQERARELVREAVALELGRSASTN